MASRITIYGNPAHKDVRRLQREMNALYVESELRDPRKDARAARASNPNSAATSSPCRSSKFCARTTGAACT